jgi:hypothetical protein
MKGLMIIFFLIANCAFAQVNSDVKKSEVRESKYHEQADSIRKKHLTPRHNDSIDNAKTDRMPVIKTDTNKTDPNMPVSRPKSNQHMPVKELSDTTNKK